MRGYDETIEIISDIMERYDKMMPDIFQKLNIYEKKILEEHPRHTLCDGKMIEFIQKREIRYALVMSVTLLLNRI